MATLRFPLEPSRGLFKDSSVYLSDIPIQPILINSILKPPAVTIPLTFESFYSSTEGSWLIGKPQTPQSAR
jgi:hypothetical protein